MKASITRVKNGYIVKADGHAYVAKNTHEVTTLISEIGFYDIDSILETEGDKCEVGIIINPLKTTE